MAADLDDLDCPFKHSTLLVNSAQYYQIRVFVKIMTENRACGHQRVVHMPVLSHISLNIKSLFFLFKEPFWDPFQRSLIRRGKWSQKGSLKKNKRPIQAVSSFEGLVRESSVLVLRDSYSFLMPFQGSSTLFV